MEDFLLALSFSTITANAMLDAITARIDAGSGAGKIRIYAGVVPTDANTDLSDNILLAELAMSDPSAAAANSKTLTFGAIANDSAADANGVATFFRILDSADNVILQGNVTETGAGGALQLNTTDLVSGGPVSISAASFSLA